MLSRVIWNYRNAMKTQQLSSEELAQLQNKKIRALIQYAFDKIPFYHNRIRSVGKHPSDFQSLSDLKYLPVLTRRELSENFGNGMINPNVRVGHFAHTSGTSGKPLQIPYDSRYCDILTAIHARRLKFAGGSFLDKIANVSYVGSDPSTGKGAQNKTRRFATARAFGRFLFGYENTYVPVPRQKLVALGADNWKEACRSLLKIKPDILLARPSYARRIANTFRSQGLEFHTKQLYYTAEVHSSAVMRELELFYRAELFESYGCKEVGTLGCECREHSGVHLSVDYFAFEVVRDGEIVSSENESGKVVITSLHNRALPIIRYELGDFVKLGGTEKCKCGSGLPRLCSIQGRQDEGLVASDGSRIPPGPVMEFIEAELGLREYKIVQVGPANILVRLNEKDLAKREIVNAIIDYCKKLLCNEDLRVELESMSDKFDGTKNKPVVSKLGSLVADPKQEVEKSNLVTV
jgi:phenylacetate-CoA ligase